MLNFKDRPYRLLLFTAIALTLFLFFLQIRGVTFQNRTMFLVPPIIIAWTIPVLLMFFWMVYLLTSRFLFSKAITWTHVIITIFTAILIVTVLYSGINPLEPAARRYNDTSLLNKQELIAKSLQFILGALLCGQMTYVINILLGLFSNKREKITK